MKRLAIYVIYDKDGIIDSYIPYCISKLKKVVNTVVVISNVHLCDKERKKIISDFFFERDNDKFDVGAITDVLENYLGWEKIYEFDELIIMNDSTFGPLYPFEEVFNIMKSRKLDFWGLTQRSESDFDEGPITFPKHIQSYFLVIEKKMLHCKEFREYWKKTCLKISDFRSAIINYEFTFTEYFEKLGFKWGVYCQLPEFDTRHIQNNLSPYHYDSYRLIVEKKCPLLKKKLFSDEFIKIKYSDKSDLSRTFYFIKEKLQYDVNYIWENILRIYPINQIINSMILFEFVDDNDHCVDRKYNVINLSRDICFTESTQSFDKNLEYTLIINVSKEFEFIPSPLKSSINRCIEDNLIKPYRNIINLFENEDRLGMVIPPRQAFGNILESFNDCWENYDSIKRTYDKLHLSVPILSKHSPIHLINAFWCRSSLLNQEFLDIMNKERTIDNMKLASLYFQQRGYYTKIVYNTKYIFNYINNVNTILSTILCNLDDYSNHDLNDFIDSLLKRKVIDFYNAYNKIYIYGASSRTLKLFEILEEKRKIRSILVTNVEGNPDKIDNIDIIGIEKMDYSLYKDIGVIITVGSQNRNSVIKILSEKGVKNYCFF